VHARDQVTAAKGKRRSSSVDLPFALDSGLGYRAVIGCITLSNDQTLSYEARRLLDLPGVALYESRLFAERSERDTVTRESLAGLSVGLADACKLVNSTNPPHAIAFGCTSGAMILGHELLLSAVRAVFPAAHVTDPLLSFSAALRALQVRKIAFLSPYPEHLARQMADLLSEEGFSVSVAGSFSSDAPPIASVAHLISPVSLVEATCSIALRDDVEAVVVACTQLRFAESIKAAEERSGKPVISSNQSMCWHALRLAGVNDKISGFGSLFERCLGHTPSC
jgi:maleate isomerase